MTYANAVLPQALFVAARCWRDQPFLEVAEEAFVFLDQVTTVDDVFWPVGNCDWYPHGEAKALYDQQPVEASTMADAAITAYGMFNDEKYLEIICRAHRWFRGENSLGLPLATSNPAAVATG